MAERARARPLDHGRPLLSAQLRRRRPRDSRYRVADDLRVAVDAPVDFTVGLVHAFLSAVTFIGVLWFIGGALTIPGTSITIPGFLVVAAVIYAVIASGAMVSIGRRFVVVCENRNQAEAEYRYGLTRVRENGESIALLGGETEERAGLDIAFQKALQRWRDYTFQYLRTTVVSQTSQTFVPVLPLILCAPKYLAGEISLGQVMQATSAFVTVQIAALVRAGRLVADDQLRGRDCNGAYNPRRRLISCFSAAFLIDDGEAWQRPSCPPRALFAIARLT